jgi:hypothetical protein
MSRVIRPGGALLAGPPAAGAGGTPITLLVGGGADLGSALTRWAAQRPAGERWALVRSSPLELAGAADPDLEEVSFAGGCACCVAAAAFSLVIARLLRRGPWQRVLIELSPAADPGAVADALWSGPVGAALSGIEIVAIAEAAGAGQPAGGPVVRALGAADLVIAADAPGAGANGPVARDFTLDFPGDGRGGCPGDGPGDGPGDRRARAAADQACWGGPLAGLEWARLRSLLEGVRDPIRWRWMPGAVASPCGRSLEGGGGWGLDDSPAVLPGGERAGWVWPAGTVFDRRAIAAALAAFADQPPVAAVRAVIRSSRDWHAFSAGSLPGHSPHPDAAQWLAAQSRRESRIECLAHPGHRLDRAGAQAAWLACRDAAV